MLPWSGSMSSRIYHPWKWAFISPKAPIHKTWWFPTSNQTLCCKGPQCKRAWGSRQSMAFIAKACQENTSPCFSPVLLAKSSCVFHRLDLCQARSVQKSWHTCRSATKGKIDRNCILVEFRMLWPQELALCDVWMLMLLVQCCHWQKAILLQWNVPVCNHTYKDTQLTVPCSILLLYAVCASS